MEKIGYINNIRVFATISVIVLHTSFPIFIYGFSLTPSINWWIGNVFDSATHSCVPLFVMITGALFLSKEIEIKSFFKKRFMRILFPFLFWSFIYIVSEAYLSHHVQGTNFFENIWYSNFFVRLLKGQISFHLWYIYMLIGLYLFIPILNKWIRNCTEKEILYFLGIWLITIIMSYGFVANRLDSKLLPVYFSGYIGYLVLGYYLSRIDTYQLSRSLLAKVNNKNIQRSIYLLVAFITFLTTVFGVYFNSMRLGRLCEYYFCEDLTINVLLITVGIFLFIKTFNFTNKIFLWIINTINKYSYGIYLVHILVLTYLSRFGIKATFIHPLIGIPVTVVLCTAISTLMVFVVFKIPFRKYISGGN